MKNGVQLTTRAREMFDLVEKYFHSGLTQKRYCAKEGISYTTLQYWLKRYREHQAAAPLVAADAPLPERRGVVEGFIPLSAACSPGPTAAELRCVIEYPNGVTLRLNGRLEPGLLRELSGIQER